MTCIRSITHNDYPKEMFEIIYVDDHSEDDSVALLQAMSEDNLQILELEDHLQGKNINSYKKEGINYALQRAKGRLIIHTDADTLVGPKWISHHVECFQSRSSIFATAPVLIFAQDGFIRHFQMYDFISTMGVTGAGIESGLHHMANGANMSYDRKWRDGIVQQNENAYASGDDMFLIHMAAAEDEEKVVFLKNPAASVKTFAESDWSGFFEQRFRWAGKTKAYTDRKIQLVAALVFLANLMILLTAILSLTDSYYFSLLFALFLLKGLIDYSFLRRIGKYYDVTFNLAYLLLSMAFYPVYYLIVGIRAMIPLKYEWKSRMVR